MISKKLGLAALAAAASMSPAALAAESGSLASLNITVRHLSVEGRPATKRVDLTGVSETIVTDAAHRAVRIIDGLGNKTERGYDASGNIVSVRDATGAGADCTVDALGRVTAVTDAAIAGKVRRYAYDVVGHLVSATDPLGVTTTYEYDARDRKISDSTPMSANEVRTIRYGFDGRGNMTTLTDANGAVTTWGFDAAGRQISKLYANGDARSMAYDAAGRLVKLTDENGRDIISTYDLVGRRLTKEFKSLASDLAPRTSDLDVYTYDAASRMTSVTKGRYNHTLTYGYDAAGRVATETHPDGTVLHLAYDAANRLANLSLAGSINSQPSTDNYAVAYGYDGRGLLSTVTSGDYATRYDYRANGQLISTINSQISTPQGDILRIDRSYDAGARLTEVANTAANGVQVGVRYTLAADDQRVEALEETGQKWQYGYDGLKQLVSAKKTDTQAAVVPPLDQSYSYDPMGNRRAYTEQGKSIAYAANSANQYDSVTSTENGTPKTENCAYDKNGNLLNDGVRAYTWDAENQLVAVTPVNPTEGSKRVEYTYDWRMRRQDKKSLVFTNGAWTLVRTHTFKYHEWNPIEETIAEFTTPESRSSNLASRISAKRYVWGKDVSGNLHGAGGVGGLLSMKVAGSLNSQPSTDNYFYAYDGNGNVRALVKANSTNPAESAIVEHYAYDGFGRELAGSGSINSQQPSINSFKFSTKHLETETGMIYYGRRFYDANNGRWISRDIIAEAGGFNIYGMVFNDAVNLIDILGLAPNVSFMPPGDREVVNRTTNKPDYFTISGHGDENGIYDEDGNLVPVSEIAKIEREQNKDKKPILFDSCEMGLGKTPKEVANATGRPVLSSIDKLDINSPDRIADGEIGAGQKSSWKVTYPDKQNRTSDFHYRTGVPPKESIGKGPTFAPIK